MIFKSKKGVGVGQVFIFIVAAITFALIMIFGYKAVTDFLGQGEKIEFVQFKNDLESSVKKIHTEYGSVRIEKFYPPAKYKQICFVNLDDKAGNMEDLCAVDALACDVWQEARNGEGYESMDENVFLTPSAPVKIKVHRVEIENGWLCTNIKSSGFELALEGLGDRTQISLAER